VTRHVESPRDETCSICGDGFTDEEWDIRHDGPDVYDYYLAFVHEKCCFKDGTCAPPKLGPPRPPRCKFRVEWPQQACVLFEGHEGSHALERGAWTSASTLYFVTPYEELSDLGAVSYGGPITLPAAGPSDDDPRSDD
jgi:hypothetical protein